LHPSRSQRIILEGVGGYDIRGKLRFQRRLSWPMPFVHFQQNLPMPKEFLLRLVLPWALAGLILGCGHKPDGVEEQAETPGSAFAEDSAQNGKVAAAQPKPAASSSRKKGGGPHIGQIPRDAWPEVWLKDPLAVARESGAASARVAPGAGAPTAAGNNAAPPLAAKSPDEVAAQAGGTSSPGSAGDWPGMISEEILALEVKAIRSQLADRMQSVGKYSGNYKEIQVDAAELAAIAQLVATNAYAPSWKPLAKYVRDASAEMSREARSNGEKFYKPTRSAYDRLVALLDGSKPPDVEETSEKIPFSELASRYPLMKRLERGHGWMKSNVNSEALLKSEGERVVREASVVAMLARVVATPGYVDADDQAYQRFADEVCQGALAAAAAARDADFAAYAKGLDRIYKACNDCHKDFKNSE
jgi:hypothetical protein